MLRKILYSPGYGTGWVSWAIGSTEMKQFMLTYQPFIDYLEAGNNFDEIGYCGDTPPYDKYPILKQFEVDFKAKFPYEQLPYYGGLRDLKVMEVYGSVKIEDYDGYESVTENPEAEEWL